MSLGERQKPISFESAVEVVAALAEEHENVTGRPMRSIVAFGGTALAAMAIRARSDDIDVFVPDIDDAALDTVTRRFQERHGLAFKIDATPSKQIFGAIVIEDIENSPDVARIRAGKTDLWLKSLSVETMYIVKTAANRPKDQADIEALARGTSYDATLERAKQLFPWYADRGAFPEHVERLARYMARDYGRTLSQVDKDFGLPQAVMTRVAEARTAMTAHFMGTLRKLMTQRPELINFDPKKPKTVTFDAKRAGAGDEILALMLRESATVADMAANVLKEKDPARHMSRMVAIKNSAKGIE